MSVAIFPSGTIILRLTAILKDSKEGRGKVYSPQWDTQTCLLILTRTTDTQWLNSQFFATQIQIPTPNEYLGFGYM